MVNLQFNRLHNQDGSIGIDMLETGSIKSIYCNDTMINQLLGNCIEGSLANIYLRIKGNDGYRVFPLIGTNETRFFVGEGQAVFAGNAEDIEYEVYLTPTDNAWFYDIKLHNKGEAVIADVIYAQDIGLAGKANVQSNEAYNSQYIDHKVFDTANGYVVCSRQNQRQSSGFPFLQQGCLQRVRSFSVDGYPFFGLSYKFDNKIKELQAETLNNRLYQYEFAYTALQSDEMHIRDSCHITFYGAFRSNLDEEIKATLCIDEIIAEHEKIVFEKPDMFHSFKRRIDVNNTICSEALTKEELDRFYPADKRRHEEYADDHTLLSFFKDTFEHVVMMEKEKYVERAHGHIMITGKNDYAKEDLLATTSYIYGVFQSQIVVGNTSFNKMITNTRNGLNASKVSGQRIMIKKDGEYKLLTMPAVYELGFNYAKWIYKLDGELIEIVCFTRLDSPTLRLEYKSAKKYDILLVSQVCGGPSEYDNPATISREGHSITITHDENSLSKNAYPDIKFVMHVDQDFELYNDSIFYEKAVSYGEPMMVLYFPAAQELSYDLVGYMDKQDIGYEKKSFEEEAFTYRQWLQEGIHNFKLSIENKDIASQVERFNDLSLWYSHNARIHYASPHGLEQYGGAAWGTRDICQGPFEYFMVTQNYEVAKSILLKVFMYQYEENHTWPQWFMFDRYKQIQSYESHGDVIVWPLKAVAAYLLTTGDTEILNTQIPYTKDKGFDFTDYTETLYSHVKKEIAYIQEHFMNGTHLSCYGDGDWDDTLQPANGELRDKMVSGWTVTLTYQVFNEFAKALTDFDSAYSAELFQLAENIKADYHKYMIKDGVVSGFLVFDNQETKYLLHPSDNETGLTYRLLPMTRAMISEMFTKEEAENHVDIINSHLYHPDGVRLMNTTCRYSGGVNTYFMRAETAANFGREIGLQYVHAHIRYVEAMAKMGHHQETWKGLLKINPIRIDTIVPNANRRQSNCYFSSSDGAFDNRYMAMKDFDKLRDGSIGVKSGWRIYSSGSGIYLNQLISQCLGIRIYQKEYIVFDPVLPDELDGLTLQYSLLGMPVTIRYHIKNGCGVSKIVVDDKEIAFTKMDNPYRNSGVYVCQSHIHSDCVIDLYI